MKARHIAMFNLLNPGHVYPTLGLCSELVRRGHRVTYPITDCLAEKVSQTGAEPLAFRAPELMNAEKILRHPSTHDPRFWRLFASVFCPAFITAAAATVAEFEGFYRANAPDLIAYDWFSFGGRVLAERLRCPAVRLWAHFAHRGHLIREDGVCTNPQPMLGFAHLLDSFMSAHGVQGSDHLWHTESLNIYFVPKEFQFDADSFDNRSCFVGPCLNRPSQGQWTNNSGGKPVLLICESGATRDGAFLNACIRAFANTGYHVVFSVGISSPPIPADALPANFEINRDVYNIEILPHAAAMICQTGMGTALECLYFGVPMVAVPPTPYHSEVAYRVAELGLGVHLPERDVTADSLRAAVDNLVSNAAVHGGLALMQQAMRNCGGATLAANRIEEFMNR